MWDATTLTQLGSFIYGWRNLASKITSWQRVASKDRKLGIISSSTILGPGITQPNKCADAVTFVQAG